MATVSIYPSSYPQNLTPEQQEHLVSTAKEWSIVNGLAVRSPIAHSDKDPKANYAVTVPVTLFPSLFPRNCFREALAIQTAYNELYAAIASNGEWLGQAIEE